MIFPPAGANAQCFGSLSLSPGFFEFDYLVRLAVHFGSPDDIHSGVICGRSRMPGEETAEVPVWAYNVHEGLTYIRFGVESNGNITGFTPAGCIDIYHQTSSYLDGIYGYHLKLELCRPLCGPVLLGHLIIELPESPEVTWINFVPNIITSDMMAIDASGKMHYVFSPNHGGYIGSGYLYTCQMPICEEPNFPVIDLEATAGFGLAVRLTWIAGEGNTTVIRARTDRYPTGYNDGRLVVEMPSSPGQLQYYYDTVAPQGAIIYYKAFSLTKDLAGEIIENSFVECSSTDTTFTHGIIATEESSWSSIKNAIKKMIE
jgi:hypothetical protein